MTQKGVEIDESKFDAVKSFPTPKARKGVRSFLGLTEYYRKFIKDYGKIASPLTQLTSEKVDFKWGEKEEIAFRTLKEKLINPPVLIYPDFSQEMVLTTDACGNGIGAVLSQIQDKSERPIAYASRPLTDVEKKRFKDCATGLELCVLEWGCKKFRQYLYGRKFKVITDHKALLGFKSMSNTNQNLMKLKASLEEYDFEVTYKKGCLLTNADALSRMFLISCLDEETRSTLIKDSYDSHLGGHHENQ